MTNLIKKSFLQSKFAIPKDGSFFFLTRISESTIATHW